LERPRDGVPAAPAGCCDIFVLNPQIVQPQDFLVIGHCTTPCNLFAQLSASLDYTGANFFALSVCTIAAVTVHLLRGHDAPSGAEYSLKSVSAP